MRVLQRTVEQIVDPMPVVPLLHDVEPQMEDQLVDVLSPYNLQVPEQGIEVPKIIIEDIPSRRSCPEPQLAEQVAEVSTILFFLKKTVDTPVPRRGGVEGQQGFLPGQSSSSSAGRGHFGGLHGFLPGRGSLQHTAKQIIDTPVRGSGVFRSLQGSPPRQGSSKRTAEQIADIPVPGGRRHGLSPDLHLAALPAVLLGEPEQGFFFALFRVRGCMGTPGHPS